jgi:hypothetical protein
MLLPAWSYQSQLIVHMLLCACCVALLAVAVGVAGNAPTAKSLGAQVLLPASAVFLTTTLTCSTAGGFSVPYTMQWQYLSACATNVTQHVPLSLSAPR